MNIQSDNIPHVPAPTGSFSNTNDEPVWIVPGFEFFLVVFVFFYIFPVDMCGVRIPPGLCFGG